MKNHIKNSHPSEDPIVQMFLKRLPPEAANQFSTEQLMLISQVIGKRGIRYHSVNIRTTFKVPFFPFHFYFVLLLGRNVRKLSSKEHILAFMIIVVSGFFILLFLFTILLIVLYFLKSFLGINIFENFSLGIW